MAQGRSVFVTVGTTRFDALIRALDQPQTVPILASQGFNELILQIGTGNHVPSVICPSGSSSHEHANGFRVSWIRLAPSLQTYMKAASLIISHAGSGSLFEALQLRKATIAVPNAILMANHQAELADHLAAQGYLYASTPDKLLETLQGVRTTVLKKYQAGDPSGIVQDIDKLMDFGASS